MHLWRPVGLKELELVFDSEMTGFPPRLPEQPMGKLARDQFRELALLLAQGTIDTGTEMDANRKVIFLLHLPFWTGLAATDLGVDSHEKAAVLAFIENRWRQSDIPFPLPRT